DEARRPDARDLSLDLGRDVLALDATSEGAGEERARRAQEQPVLAHERRDARERPPAEEVQVDAHAERGPRAGDRDRLVEGGPVGGERGAREDARLVRATDRAVHGRAEAEVITVHDDARAFHEGDGIRAAFHGESFTRETFTVKVVSARRGRRAARSAAGG